MNYIHCFLETCQTVFHLSDRELLYHLGTLLKLMVCYMFVHYYTVETPVSDYQKCEDLVITYGRWTLTRIDPQGASSRHICFMEDNSLHGISKLRHM